MGDVYIQKAYCKLFYNNPPHLQPCHQSFLVLSSSKLSPSSKTMCQQSKLLQNSTFQLDPFHLFAKSTFLTPQNAKEVAHTSSNLPILIMLFTSSLLARPNLPLKSLLPFPMSFSNLSTPKKYTEQSEFVVYSL